MHEFRMPSLGADMEAGTLVEWLKQPGDPVARGDIVAVVETEKGAIEIEIFEDGVMGEQLVAEGATVPVGTVLTMIGAEGEALEAPPPPVEAPPTKAPEPALEIAEAAPAEPVAVPPPPPVPAPPPSRTRSKVSPAARAYARDHEIDLSAVNGSGPDGAILRADVEHAAPGPETRPRKIKPGLDLDKMRHAIAAAMARSKREIPHYYLGTRINLRHASGWLEDTNAGRDPENRLLMGVLFLKAVARALTAHKQFNGFYTETGFEPGPGVHIGTAIAIRGGGLVAPAIHDCDMKSLDEIMAALRDLTARVRAGTIRSSEMSDPTITVSSLGERGVDSLFGVIYPPQVAILGFGTPRLEPVAHGDGALAAEPIVEASLAADHRVTDGHLGGRFLVKIDALLQEPEKL